MSVTIGERSKIEIGLAIVGTTLLLGAQAAVLMKLSEKPNRADLEQTYVRKDVLDVRLASLEREMVSLRTEMSAARVEIAELKSKPK